MIPKEVYWQRRKELKSMAGEGLLLLAGNAESAMNYRGNTYHFRQDSSFLYFFGVDKPGFFGICDLDQGKGLGCRTAWRSLGRSVATDSAGDRMRIR